MALMFNSRSIVNVSRRYSFVVRWLLNAALFDLGWWVCIKHASGEWPYLGPLVVALILVFFLCISTSKKLDLTLMLALALLGTVIDTLYVLIGMIDYQGGYPFATALAPLWMTSLWALYGFSVNCSLSWLRCSLLLAALVGAGGAVFSYLAGVHLGAAEFLWPEEICIVAIGIVWAFIVPLSLKFSNWLKNNRLFLKEPGYDI